MTQALSILAGRTAYHTLKEHGWNPELFTAMVGASGGAKLLGLTHLDRFLFGDYLQRSDHPMELYGSSIGSWRHAALASPDPLTAITELQERYLNQAWDENDARSPGEIIDELCHWVLDGICHPEMTDHVANHPRFTTHIITSRGLGLNNRRRSLDLAAGMGLSALGNMVSRRLLEVGFQRVVFSSGPSKAFQFDDFKNAHVTLTPDSLKPALLASGSIPFLMPGQQNVGSGPKGQYWDGGVIDYHFDFINQTGDGLILYPHFSEAVIKGWFDKKLPWRTNSAELLDRTIVLAPSASYLASLPHGKIPDRKDFNTFSQQDRMAYWQTAMDMSQQLADGLTAQLEDSNPVSRVRLLT